MARFNYHARDRRGQMVQGMIEATDTRELRSLISAQSLILIKAEPLSESFVSSAPLVSDGGSGFFVLPDKVDLQRRMSRFFEPKIKLQDTLMFYQQLQTIYVVGMPLLRGLEVIADQVDHPRLKKIVQSLAVDVGEGLSLNEASKRYPELFSSVATSLIAAGEASGRMEDLLGHTVNLVREQAENQAKVKSTLFYPKLVFGMIGIVFSVVFYFVIPKISGFFSSLGAELPLITRIMLGISAFLSAYWYLVLLTCGTLYFVFNKWVTSQRGREQWDRFKLKLPLIGPLLILLETYNFCAVFSLLLASGLPITEALDVVKGTISSPLLQKDIEHTAELVQRGGTLHDGLDQAGHFPKLLRSFVAIGEETGSIENALQSIGGYYKGQADYRMSNLSKAMEPLLLAIIFGIVLLLALAIFMPMWQMGSAIKR